MWRNHFAVSSFAHEVICINFIFLHFSNFLIVFLHEYWLHFTLLVFTHPNLLLAALFTRTIFLYFLNILINIVGILEVYLETHLRCYSKSKYFVDNPESISCSKYFGCAVGCYDLQQRGYFPVFTTICYRVQQDIVYLEFYELYCKCLSACWNHFWFLNNWQ